MSTRLQLVHVSIASIAARQTAAWWSNVLGWELIDRDTEHPAIVPPGNGLPLRFVGSDQPKSRRNRLHFHLGCPGTAARRAMADKLIQQGARRADVGQGRATKLVLRDPEGNEFCLLEPLVDYPDTGPLTEIIIPARNPEALAEFWAQALGYVRVPAVNENAEPLVGLRRRSLTGPALTFSPTDDGAPRLGRVRLAVGGTPQSTAYLKSLGAKYRKGEDDAHGLTMHDSEGNAFYVLGAPPPEAADSAASPV
ncbi:MAG: hypothetical protein CSA58_05850 [Micrococcales bacterium]|nr:MAG: hypothetical protein CSB46_04920 [Micrococcales bacterium]PIE27166.1 MAG: hypothetical protein CSA58_05850 [Micrococcales bacterium]